MREEPLRALIESYLQRQNRWINGGELERLALEAGFKSSNASRRCREMVTGKLSDGKTCPIVLERKIAKGTVWYRHLQGEVPKVEAHKPTFREIVNADGQRVMIMA